MTKWTKRLNAQNGLNGLAHLCLPGTLTHEVQLLRLGTPYKNTSAAIPVI